MQVNHCQLLRDFACRPFFLLGSFDQYILDCFFIFVLTHHECVTVLSNTSLPFNFTTFLCHALICRSGKPSVWKILIINVTVKEIKLNCKHNAKCFNFYLHSVSCRPRRNQTLRNNFDWCLSDAVRI